MEEDKKIFDKLKDWKNPFMPVSFSKIKYRLEAIDFILINGDF